MKKAKAWNNFAWLAFMGLWLAGVAGAETQPSLKFQLTVTVNADAIDFAAPGPFFLFGTIGYNGNTHSAAACGIHNIGSPIRFLLASTPVTSGWTQDEGQPGTTLPPAAYRLSGIFTNKSRTLSLNDFQANDVFRQAGRVCSGTDHALDSESSVYKGFAIPRGEWRDMFFRLEISPEGPHDAQGKLFDGEMQVRISVTAMAD